MIYTYIIRSTQDKTKLYKGFTTLEVRDRLLKHNQGQVSYTSKYMPWEIVWFAGFETQKLATDFEKYLKSASGIAFMRKRLIDYQE